MTSNYQYQFTFLQQFIVVMMGFSFTKILDKYIPSINNFQVLIIFILIMLNTIRFYYGNWMYLQELISKSCKTKFSAIQIIANYIIIIVDCLCLMMLGIVEHYSFFYWLEFILFLDAIGFLLIIFHNKSNWSLQQKWTINNLTTVIVLLVIHLLQFALKSNISSQLELVFFFISSLICTINTIVGFFLSWNRFYLGK